MKGLTEAEELELLELEAAGAGAAPASSEPESEIGIGESALRGGAQGVSFGFADELAGALHNPLGAAKKAAGFLGYDTEGDKDVKNYLKRKFEYQANDDKAREANPWSYGLGEVGGGAATLLAPGVGAATKGIAGAAKLGALTGLGNSKSDTLGGAALDAGIGAGTGAVIGKIADVAFNPAQNARELTIRHLRPTPKVAKDLGKDRLNQIAQEVLDTGALEFGAKAESTSANLATLLDEVGAYKGDLVEASTGKVDPSVVAERIENEVIAPLRKTAKNDDIANAIQKEVDAFRIKYSDLAPDSAPSPYAGLVPDTAPQPRTSPSMSAQQLEAEKMAWQNRINYGTADKPLTSAQADTARILKEEAEKIIPDPAFIPAKRAYGNLATAKNMVDRTAALTDGGGGLMGHIADVGVGHNAISGLMNGNPIGLGFAGARALTKGRLTSAGAVTLNKISKIANKSPEFAKKFFPVLQNAAKRGAQSLAATHFILSSSDEAYQKAMSEHDENEP